MNVMGDDFLLEVNIFGTYEIFDYFCVSKIICIGKSLKD